MRNLVLVALGALLVASCDAKVTEPSDKNTNWLRQCSASAECGAGLQCLCGVCTSVCDRDEQCSDRDPSAVCAEISGPRCGSAVPTVCSVRCGSDGACTERNDDLACVESVCEPRSLPASDAGLDAGGSSLVDAGDPAPDASDVDASAPPVDAGPPAAISEATQEAVAGGCGSGFACAAWTAEAGDVVSFVVENDAVAWIDWGSVDELSNHRHDGAVVRMPKAGGRPERVYTGLDRPFRLWLDADVYYWLSGDPADHQADQGLQTLYGAPRAGGAEPAVQRSDALLDVQVRNGAMVWLQPFSHETQGEGVNFFFAQLAWGTGSASVNFLPGSHQIGAFDGANAYLEHGEGEILRYPAAGVGTLLEIVSDPPAYLPNVDGDRLWLIHTDVTHWVGWMPIEGGAITHVAPAGNYLQPPQPGSSLVWHLTLERTEQMNELRAIPKAGGDAELAFSWPYQGAPNPIWIADGDGAWVFAHGVIVRVSRQ